MFFSKIMQRSLQISLQRSSLISSIIPYKKIQNSIIPYKQTYKSIIPYNHVYNKNIKNYKTIGIKVGKFFGKCICDQFF